MLAAVYVYRRRAYILCWVSGWTLTALSLLLAARHFEYIKAARRGVYGISQFLGDRRRAGLRPRR